MLESEEDGDGASSKLKDAEITYITEIIKQVVNNGTLDTCSLNGESFPDEEELKEVTETLFELTSTFYYVSNSAN